VQLPNFIDAVRAISGVDAWPLPNVWLGVSAENQQWADIRIPALLDTQAAVRFCRLSRYSAPLISITVRDIRPSRPILIRP
jgi:protein gp37